MAAARADSSYFRALARGGIFAMSGKVLTYPIGLLLAIVLARILTPAELGGYFLAMSLVLIVSALAQFGIGRVMVKFIAQAREANDPGRTRQVLATGTAWVSITAALAALALATAPGDWLLRSLEDGDLLRRSMHTIAWLVVAYAAVEFCCEVLRGFNDLPAASLFAEQLLQRLLLLVALAIAWPLASDMDLDQVMKLIAVSSAAAGFIGLLWILRKTRALGRQLITPLDRLAMFAQAPPFFLLRMNFWLMNTAPVWILGMYHSAEIVALYGVANLLSLLVLAPWTVVNASLGPSVVKLTAEDRPEMLRRLLGSVAALVAVAAALVVAVLLLFGRFIIELFNEALIPAWSTVIILAAGRGLSVAFGSPALLLSMTRHQLPVFWLLLITAPLGVAGYVVAARFGDQDWVAACGATIVVVQAIALWLMAKHYTGLSTLPTFRLSHWQDIVKVLSRNSATR